MSREIESCKQWLIDNKLSLHLGKTESILFGSKRNLKKIESFDAKCCNETLEQWNEIIDEGNCIDVAYLDFRKAFDLVSHEHLIYKLTKYGIEGKILN